MAGFLLALGFGRWFNWSLLRPILKPIRTLRLFQEGKGIDVLYPVHMSKTVMKIDCISDTHFHHKKLNLPGTDIPNPCRANCLDQTEIGFRYLDRLKNKIILIGF